MNREAVGCPHCGARHPDRAPGLAGTLSPDEIRALLVTDARNASPRQGLFATLLLPHGRTHGVERTIELALSIACAPLVLAGAAAFFVQSRIFRRHDVADTLYGEALPVFVMTVFGSFPLMSLLGFLDLELGTRVAIVLAEIVGLCVRGVIRSRAASHTSADLARLDVPPAAPAIPKAQALLADQASSPPPIVPASVAPPPVESTAPPSRPSAEPALPPGEEPRLLR